jgi:sugar phosphate isomerase/epimerase
MEQIISISTVAYDGYAMELAFEHIAALGVKYVEVAYIQGYMDPFEETIFTQKQAETLKKQLDKRGLECYAFSSHLNLGTEEVVEIFKRRIYFAAVLGAQLIISTAASLANEAIFLKNIIPIAERAESYGLKVALENPSTGPEDLFDTGKDGADLVKKLNIPNVGLNYDSGNLITFKMNSIQPEQDIMFALPYCLHLHIKDVMANPQKPGWIHTVIGSGIVNYDQIFTKLKTTVLPISLEIPLRFSRNIDGSAVRLSKPVPIETIDNVLKESLIYVRRTF